MAPKAMMATNLLGGAAAYGMSEMFKPKGTDIGQLKSTLAPQLQAGQFQQQMGQNIMDPRGSYLHGVANQIGLQNRNNMFAQQLLNRRSLGQFGNPAMSGKVNQELFRNVDQNTGNTLARMQPQMTQMGLGAYQQGTDNVGSYLGNIAQGQIGNQQMEDVYRQKQMSMISPFVQGAIGCGTKGLFG